MDRKKSFVIGPRTHKNILEGKKIRKNEVGDDIFEDYWTDSDDDASSTFSKTSNHSSKRLEKELSIDDLSTVENDNVLQFTRSLRTRNTNQSPSKSRVNLDSLHLSKKLDETFISIKRKKSSQSADTHTVTREAPKTLTDASLLSKTFVKTAEMQQTSKRNLRSAVDSPLSKTFGKNIEIPKTPQNRSTVSSPLSKTSSKNVEVPETSKRNLRSTVGSPLSETSSTNIEMPETPKRNLRSTVASPLSKTSGKNTEMAETPKKILRSTVVSPLSKTFDKENEMSTTAKRMLSSSGKVRKNISMLPEISKNVEASDLTKTFNKKKKKMSILPKRSSRSATGSDDDDIYMLITKKHTDASDRESVSSLSEACHINIASQSPRQVSKTDKKNSKKSNMTTKTNNITETLAQYDEYDRKIMDMISKPISDRRESIPNHPSSINKESSSPATFLVKKKQTNSNISKGTLKASKKTPSENTIENDPNYQNHISTNRNVISKKSIASNRRKEKRSKDNEVSPQSSHTDDLENLSNHSIRDLPEKSVLLPESDLSSQSKKQKEKNTVKPKNHDKTDKSITKIKSTGKKQKVKAAKSVDKTGVNYKNSQISSENVDVDDSILASNPMLETANQEKIDNEISSVSSKTNISGKSKRSVEDADINEIDNTGSESTKRQKKVTNKTIQDINDCDEQHVLETNTAIQESVSPKPSVDSMSKQRKKNKKAKSPNLNEKNHTRRSKRQRFQPLDNWRNERVLYRFENGDIKVLGIDEGTKEDDCAIKQLHKLMSKNVNSQKNPSKTKPKKLQIYDNKKHKKFVNLHIKFSRVPWNSPPNSKAITSDAKSEYSYSLKRMIETKKNGFGYVQIGIAKQKPSQYMPEEDVHLTVVRGKLEITVEKNVYEVTENDMFVVPRGCVYNIKNVGNKKALIAYTVGNFGFL